VARKIAVRKGGLNERSLGVRDSVSELLLIRVAITRYARTGDWGGGAPAVGGIRIQRSGPESSEFESESLPW
jgi:hypothetical protein